MPGGRKTHAFRQGKPLPIVFIQIVSWVVGLLWLVSFYKGWTPAIAASAALICVLLISHKLIKFYERRGLAVPIPGRQVKAVTFPGGMPRPLLALRYAVVVVVLLMLGFGFAPMPLARARLGIIGCVLGLFLLAVLNIALVIHYVNNSRASEK